jgi:hypothetical protein
MRAASAALWSASADLRQRRLAAARMPASVAVFSCRAATLRRGSPPAVRCLAVGRPDATIVPLRRLDTRGSRAAASATPSRRI